MLRRLTYGLDALVRRTRRSRESFERCVAVSVFHLSTVDHLAIFCETLLTRRPALPLRIISWMREPQFEGEYPNWKLLRSKHDVRWATPDLQAGTETAVLLYSPWVRIAQEQSRNVRHGFAQVKCRRRVIVHGDGSVWDGAWQARALRKFTRPVLARLTPLRDRAEQRLIEARLMDEPAAEAERMAGPPAPRLILDYPFRILQDPITGTATKPDLLERTDGDLYEDTYHYREYLDRRPDYPALAQEYRSRRWRNMRKVGLDPATWSAKPRALDVGCGTGQLAALLAEQGFEVTGIDVSETAIAQARRDHPALNFRVCRLEELSATGDAYHLITLSHVIEHVRDDVGLLRRLRDLLAPDGTIYIETPWLNRRALRRRPDWHRQRDHIREYTKAGLAAIVRDAHLKVLNHSDSLDEPDGEPYQFLLAAKANLT